ncbi:hypothetical protein SAMN05660862_3295 [Sphingobacterium psychroaquaticum]|uniref:Uncharacterized protein n=1 Tax=Sphingobacterium psychroaquaticum TaxID=561061 RepID=A0A1X7KY66_9SPHI|nr:hypothetical protein SAMN05660862_3295 [Sphingobacterium psychroaquaticum]
MIEIEGGFLPIVAVVGIWAFQGAVIGGAIAAYGSIRAAEMSAR